MSSIKSVVFLFLSINFFNSIWMENSTSPSLSSNSSKLSNQSDPVFYGITFNLNVSKSHLSSSNQSSDDIHGLETTLTSTKSSITWLTNEPDQVLVSEAMNSTESYQNSQEFNSTINEFMRTDVNFNSGNFSLTREVPFNNTGESDEKHQDSVEDDRDGLHLEFDNSQESNESQESTSGEKSQEQPMLTLILNELKVKHGKDRDLTPDEKFIEFISKIKKLYNTVMKDLNPIVITEILTANISFGCLTGLAKAYEALNNNQHWVFKMLDSNGHFPSGMMSGTLSSLGDYDQCLRVETPDQSIRGQYCLLKIKSDLPEKKGIITFKDRYINLNGTDLKNTWIDSYVVKNLYNFYYFSIMNGICVPSVCARDDLVTLAKQFLSPFHLEVDVENCATKEDTPLELNCGQRLSLVIIVGWVAVSLLATAFDITFITQKPKNIFIKSIECFSLRFNSRKFFDTSSTVNTKSYEYNLQFCNGVKVLSIVWVIIGHTYISGAIFFNKDIPTANFYFANLVDTINMPKQLFTQFVINALLAVDTFFFISGFLIVYLAVLKIARDNHKTSFQLFLFLRWIRFSPTLIAMISINFLWPLLGSGPLFHENYTRFMTDACYSSWWRNLLFISNWYPPEEQCMIHTWYMSADFQIYILAFFVIRLTCSNVKSGLLACSGLSFLGVIVTTIIAYCNDLPPTIMYQADIENMALHTSLMHYKTYNHLTPYFLGSFVACLLLKKQKFHISPLIKCLFWAITGLGSVFVVFVSYVWTALEWDYTQLEAALYFGSHRFIWSAGLAWIAFNCAQSKGGIVNSILSSHVFKIPSRLTFSMYLSHMIVIWYNFFRTKHLFFSTHYDMLFNATGIIGFTLVFAFFVHVIFEAPVLNLVKMFIEMSNRSRSLLLDHNSSEQNRKFGENNNISVKV